MAAGSQASLYPVTRRFWAASDAWFRSRVDRDRAAMQSEAGLRLRRSFTRRAGVWRDLRPGKLIDRRSALGRRGWIRTDPRLQRDVLKLIGAVQPNLIQATDHHLGRLAFSAFRGWPVSSGLSRALLDLEYVPSGPRLRATLSSRAPYTLFILDQPWRRLIDRPSRAVAQRIADEGLRETARGRHG